MTEQTFVLGKFRNKGTNFTLYYYQGNFFHPLDIEPGPLLGKLRAAMWRFASANAGMIKADRKDPEYKTLAELSDLGPPA